MFKKSKEEKSGRDYAYERLIFIINNACLFIKDTENLDDMDYMQRLILGCSERLVAFRQNELWGSKEDK